jgi:hypothetical protein
MSDLTFCRSCGEDTISNIILRPDTPHYGEERCIVCGAQKKWIPKPKNIENLKKRPNNCPNPIDLGISRCEICRRPKEMLGHNEVLEVHHKDGNPANNEKGNLLVCCTEHHKLIHHIKKYTYEHHLDG